LSAQDANGKASPSDSLKDLFAQIDTNGDGKITKAEFEDKLGAGGTNVAAADNVFNKMDADNDGSVSLDEMATALKPKSGRSSPRASWRWRGCVDAGSAGRSKLLDHEQRWIDHDHADIR
jgi:Ca2+-binding EF-hand superfamily protein